MRKGVEFWLRVAITLALGIRLPEKYMPCPRNTG